MKNFTEKSFVILVSVLNETIKFLREIVRNCNHVQKHLTLYKKKILHQIKN